MKQIEKPSLKIRLRHKDMLLLSCGNVIQYDRNYLPFKIQLECIEIPPEEENPFEMDETDEDDPEV